MFKEPYFIQSTGYFMKRATRCFMAAYCNCQLPTILGSGYLGSKFKVQCSRNFVPPTFHEASYALLHCCQLLLPTGYYYGFRVLGFKVQSSMFKEPYFILLPGYIKKRATLCFMAANCYCLLPTGYWLLVTLLRTSYFCLLPLPTAN